MSNIVEQSIFYAKQEDGFKSKDIIKILYEQNIGYGNTDTQIFTIDLQTLSGNRALITMSPETLDEIVTTCIELKDSVGNKLDKLAQ